MALGYSIIGTVLLEMGDASGALENFRKQLKIHEDLSTLDASNTDKERDLVGALINISNAALRTKDNSTALAQFNRALEISRTFSSDDLEAQSNLTSIYEGIGATLLSNGDAKTAIENFQKAIELRESQVEKNQMNVKGSGRAEEI